MVRCAIGLVVEDGRILICRRPRGTHLGGTWEFPGGKKRRGETYAGCLRREMLEEVGLRVRVGPRLAILRHWYPEQAVELHAFVCWPLTRRRRAAPQRRVKGWLLGPASALRQLGDSRRKWLVPEELACFPQPAANLPLVEAIASGKFRRKMSRPGSK